MNYDEAIKYIKETAKFGSKYGLERTEKILELLGNPHKHIKTIHVAGTNGKGSTTAMLTSILMESGYKVGSYISPYIEEFEERMQINRNNIPKEELAEVITEVSKAVSKVVDLGYVNPTEFEIITCAGFLYFYKKNVDYAIIEVGLGGRLDSTNVITPILSIISSISLDHTQILGDTLDKIAYEKAGIIKENVPVILFPQEEAAEKVIEKTCRERNAKLIKVPRNISEYVAVTSSILEGKEIKTQRINLKDEYINSYDLSLLGKHQILNSTVVVYAVLELINLGVKISKENIINGFKKVQWPGRLEIMRNKPLVVIDGAHNIDGIKKLTESIDLYFKYNKLILILGILADKQVQEMIETIAPKAEKIISVTPHSDRAELAEDLKIAIESLGVDCEAIDSYEEAYEKALSYCNDDDLLLISGSLYMIGDMRKIIRNFK
ncbi:MAG: bifunctional folylpolyglutamate synthase/dihydrofolate synthase [Clostridium argentinense]|uniref:tetrahydrofolate synthase n=1 Tax=Clostridium faecium TaxID=2762223 RepID=A0ABR8YVW1_9CLOT|nr:MULTISPECIES: folylpolyglutamate synthase/dihydrofolate synthase family protein [Clostridium]MBD8048370.1 bifunctional folylpolyglutamate synthase/dihydrofolate synthase [Clostridium faecium]MBS5824866.1 bifunctional folylpolyglutamate synthase/dihydrofolate synthase [Clostridium argentinense]MDU1347888.1 folylpolyglutamate synthase/dihydrofolate synthase family protein [Clostridium argentinense]